MLPCQRKTRTQTRKGRSHQALTPRGAVSCPNCGTQKQPHSACRECGYVRPGLKLSRGSKAKA